MSTKIEWADVTWNPVTGCTKISEGCANCYAERMSKRFAGRFGYPKDEPFRVTLHPDKLEEPLKWKKPRKVFVCSMGDLFHEDVPVSFLLDVFDVIYKCPQHTFIILTKRPERMKWLRTNGPIIGKEPLPNVWLGVTAENQEQADKRIPILLQTPAVVRFVSVEPMLGPVDLQSEVLGDTLCRCGGCMNYANNNPDLWQAQRIDWVICGGETGPGARPMHPDWVRSLRDQCNGARVPFFFKQWGEFEYLRQGLADGKGRFAAHKVGKKKAGRLLDGREWNEFPKGCK